MKKCVLIISLLPCLLIGQNRQQACERLQELIQYNQTIPYCQVSHNGVVYPPKADEVQLRTQQLGESFAIRLVVPPRIQKNYAKLARYAAYGLSLYAGNGYHSRLVFRDSAFKKAFSTQLIYAFRDLDTHADLPGTAYRLRFDSLIQLDCAGNRYDIEGFDFGTFSIKTAPERAPELSGFEKPSLLLRVNGRNMEYEELIVQEDDLKLYLDFKRMLPVGVEQSNFSAFYRIHEAGCFGGKVHLSKKKGSFPIQIPVSELQPGFGGQFFVIIEELIYTDNKGKQYIITNPFTDSIQFIHNPRLERSASPSQQNHRP